MSSFILEDEGICRILDNLKTLEYKTKFGKKLLKMNIDAIGQRYPHNLFLNKSQQKERIAGFVYKNLNSSKLQSYKSLQCFLYQCSEGTIPNRKLFKELRKVQSRLSNEILTELPEYDVCEWG
jgi:hypothetical protein